MKKLLLLSISLFVFYSQIKSQDIGITGFVVPASDTTIHVGGLLPLSPILRNYGPETIVQGDTVFVKILIDNVSLGTSKLIIPANMTVASGESVYINFSTPINLSSLSAGTYLFCCTTAGSNLGSDPNSLNNKSCFMLTVQAIPNPTDVNYQSSEKVLVFPNPANEVVHISTPMPFNSLVLVDISGRIVYDFKGNTSELTIKTDEFQTGIYFLSIMSENNIITKKISITR